MSHYLWRCRSITLDFSDLRTRVMGILNVTPDSFSDGGQYLDHSAAVVHATQMAAAGAGIIDIGGESTRPGAEPVSVEEELRRVMPVVQAVSQRLGNNVAISIDTTKAEVARQAIRAGAHIINDISAGQFDPEILQVAATTGAGIVLMHMQGTPRTMQTAPDYEDVMLEVVDFLSRRVACARDAGIMDEQTAVDPGIGFGKTADHNLRILAHLQMLQSFHRPVLVGPSRKSFIGKTLHLESDDRRAGTLATVIWCTLFGHAQIVRVHDVDQTVQALQMIEAIKQKRFR